LNPAWQSEQGDSSFLRSPGLTFNFACDESANNPVLFPCDRCALALRVKFRLLFGSGHSDIHGDAQSDNRCT
jgi:hypothetical protein